MANEIKADSNTYVGYNHITSEFYVKNLDTKTAAKTATDAKLVLDITAPGNKVSLESIAQLEHRLEPITSISYTLEDTGRYIKTIYFNEYKSLSIQYDEPSLYIQGSNEMWDMSSTLSQDSVSLFMWQYFVYYVGLNMPRKLMNAIIAYYKEIQKPYVYNIVTPLTDEEKDAGKSLTYSNQFTMNNADHTSKGEYTGTKNPDNLYTLNVYDIESIKTYKTDLVYAVDSIEKSKNRINLTEKLSSTIFTEGMKIRIADSGDDKLDGDYTVAKQIDDVVDPLEPTKAKSHIIISEEERFAVNFVPLNNAYILKVVDSENPEEVKKITITDNLITCTEEPECKVGDLIQITSDTGKYIDNLTVKHVDNKNIYVNQNIQSQANITPEDNAKVWINAYGIRYMGYDTYTEIKSAQQVSKVDGKNLYILDYLQDNQYVPGETIYIDYGNGVVTQHTIDAGGVHLSGVTTSGYTQGYLTLTPAPATHNLPYVLGKEPVMVQKRNTITTPENSFTLTSALTLKQGDVFEVFNTDINGVYTVESIEGNKVFVVRENDDKDIPAVTFADNHKGIVQIRVYSERILLNMLFSKRADKMPMGEFMLDNDQQFSQYLELYNIVTPKSQNYANFNQEVDKMYYLGDNLLNDEEATYMNLVGLYSDVYPKD